MPGAALRGRPVPASSVPTCPNCPDLVIQDFEVTCSLQDQYGFHWGTCPDFTSNQVFSVHAKVRNIGSAPATLQEGWILFSRAASDRRQVLQNAAPTGGIYIPAGTEVTGPPYSLIPALGTFGGTPPGIIEFIFVVDPEDHVRETDERNTFIFPLQIVAPPPVDVDLRATSVTVSPASGPPNAGFVISTTLTNSGPPRNVVVGCDIGGRTGVSAPGAGQSTVATLPPIGYSLPPGNKTVTCTLDPDNSVREADEGNNSASTSFTVTQP